MAHTGTSVDKYTRVQLQTCYVTHSAVARGAHFSHWLSWHQVLAQTHQACTILRCQRLTSKQFFFCDTTKRKHAGCRQGRRQHALTGSTDKQTFMHTHMCTCGSIDHDTDNTCAQTNIQQSKQVGTNALNTLVP